jgi:environmental stress-induced protein Ves
VKPAGSIRVLRAALRVPRPWKNGGGLTREVAAHPAGSDLADFDWRVSIAEISAAGPFSAFPGIDRRMAVLAGRLSLAIGAAPALELAPDLPPLEFAGEAVVFAVPLAGPVTDLNVMTRRGRCAARLAHEVARGPLRIASRAGHCLILALADLELSGAAGHAVLAPLDALLLAGEVQCELAPRLAPAAIYRIEISPTA